LSDKMLVWLSVWSEVQIVCSHPADATSVPKPYRLLPHLIQTGFTFLVHRFTHVALEKRPLNGYSVVVVVVAEAAGVVNY